MGTWTLRLGLSLMVVVSFWANALPAQEVLLVPAIPYEPAHHGPPANPFMPRSQPAPADHFTMRLLNSHGIGCKADPYNPAASSWHYEARFIFGSSRSFFDLPCEPCRLGEKHRR
ncbi:MAG: hypothetical protein HY289_03440 [Planctomycetes bacterium]|nr:hypothetical protein [Planctomycetota bacterium]